MSDLELQRTAVRMLHDPSFVAAVYADPERALAGLALSPAERAQLTRADVRAWQVDPHRKTRVLRAIIDEYFATVATLWTTPSATVAASQALDAFFGTPRFHEAIRARRSLVLVFAGHLEGLVTGTLGRGLLALEHAFARVRRAPAGTSRPTEAGDAGDGLVRAPRAVTLALPAGTLAAWEALAKDLRGRGDPIEVLLTGAGGKGYRPSLPSLAAASTAAEAPANEFALFANEYLLIEQPRERGLPGAVAASVSFIGEGLHALFVAAETATPREVLTRRLLDEGLDSGEAAELLDELVADALLVSP